MIRVELDGFSPLTRNGLRIATGETARVDLRLAVGGVSEAPNIDAIQEVKIESNSPPAEFGRFNGSVINLTTGDTRRAFRRPATELQTPPATSLNLPGIPSTARYPNTLPTFSIVGYQQLGSPPNTATDFSTSVTQIANTLTWLKGQHTLKLGADLRWPRLDVVQPPSPTGAFTFSSLFTVTEATFVGAGYALVRIEMAGITSPFTAPVFPFLQTVSHRTLDNVSPAFTLAEGPSVAPIPLTPRAGLGQGVFAVNRDLGSGYVQQWNTSLQRELTPKVAVELLD